MAGLVTYSTDKHLAANLVTLPAARAFEIIEMNRRGEKPERLDGNGEAVPTKPSDLVEQESLTRFDKRRKNKGKRKEGGGKRDGAPAKAAQGGKKADGEGKERQERNRPRSAKEGREPGNKAENRNNGGEKRRRDKGGAQKKAAKAAPAPEGKAE